ncbi:hypothetical protein EPO15_17085 [bacterium]|nr:MAG: hypothetical protein EPO15_17085 [bacterium]
MQPQPEAQPLPPIRFGLNELTGAFGDIGTFAPVYLGLVAVCGLPPGRTLVLFGAVYAGAALFFRLPMPVQPLKAMAAIAIAGRLPASTLAAAGLWIGAVLSLLAVAGRVDWLGRWFTRPIVKGIQCGVGLILVLSGLRLVFSRHAVPAAGAAPNAFSLPSAADLKTALLLLVIPQLPLTLGNAVYAVSDVARDYFGAGARRATPRNLALSLGISNLLIGAAGGLPVCHGSGGMTAHYGFGARSAGATLAMGLLLIALGAALPDHAYRFIGMIPSWLLGAMLVYPGVCHVLLVRGLEERLPLALAMGLIGAVSGNLAWTLAFGLAAQWVLDRAAARRPAPSRGQRA